ncbi:vacuolar iron transporter homolog 3-like [Silene latifolia]|uniref:vacuolar iron transporter homolog 3-like n=1 Tax=Silene latifolia TaxID=37657 RepID=UPI003D782FBB
MAINPYIIGRLVYTTLFKLIKNYNQHITLHYISLSSFKDMATSKQTTHAPTKLETITSNIDEESQQQNVITQKKDDFDYTKRAQWLRAAVLGVNDGLVTTASLMMGVGAVREDVKAMILTGFAGMVAGACSMAIGEFVSVYSQLDIEVAQKKRESMRDYGSNGDDNGGGDDDEVLPNPLQAAGASALAFSTGAMVPLLAASFIREYKVRVGVIVAAVTLALMFFGWLGAFLGRAPVVRASLRVLFGGWIAMAITFGLTKVIGTDLL